MLCELAQGRLNLSREVEALVGGDDVVVAQLEVAVEPAPQLKQNRLELSEQLGVSNLRESLVVHRLAAAV